MEQKFKIKDLIGATVQVIEKSRSTFHPIEKIQFTDDGMIEISNSTPTENGVITWAVKMTDDQFLDILFKGETIVDSIALIIL